MRALCTTRLYGGGRPSINLLLNEIYHKALYGNGFNIRLLEESFI